MEVKHFVILAPGWKGLQWTNGLAYSDSLLVTKNKVFSPFDCRSAASGVWCTMFFIYMTYTLLALHLQECVVSGLMLAVTQLVRVL
jgi:hypothetical protein